MEQSLFWLFLVALLIFVIALIRSIFKFSLVKTDQLKSYYLWAVIISTAMVLSFILGMLGYYIAFVVLFFASVIVSLFRSRRSMSAQREEAREIAPLVKGKKITFFDLFTRRGWIKIALNLGLGKAVSIIFIIWLIISFIFLLFINLFIYPELTISYVLAYAIVLSLIGSLSFYSTLKDMKKK